MEARWIRRAMVLCGGLEFLALAVWIGGLIVIVGAVIPAVFNSFAMEPGGRFLTRVFDGYNRLVLVSIVILTMGMGFRYWAGRADGFGSLEITRSEAMLLSSMALIAVLIIAVLGPHAVELQEKAFAAKEEDLRKAAYAAFFKSHMVVRALYVLNFFLGVGLLLTKLKRWMRI